MQFYEINIYQVVIFRLYTIYNKHQMIEIVNETREKSQILSQVILLLTVHTHEWTLFLILTFQGFIFIF